MSRPEPTAQVQSLGPLPRGPDGEPVFAAPWEAQAFAIAVALNERGVFDWSEWGEALGREIARDRTEPGAQPDVSFYEHWLAALEALIAAKGVASPARLDNLRGAFERAARATPHGAPILLTSDPLQASPPDPPSAP